ncbi:hypothetical protein CWO91_36565 [Bradyrhizobium genosp. SA-3]|nr:hypothetical protein CWO91_36565 [Bradyrhizobium genosp. SA-3]
MGSFTSPKRGEVDLLLAMRSIVLCKSGEGAQFFFRGSATPHPALCADLSLWERWSVFAATFDRIS